MPSYDKVQGLVAQGVGQPSFLQLSDTPTYGPGSYTWVCPKTGYYKFIGWGGGGGGPGASTGNGGGGSGAYVEKTMYLMLGQTASITVGVGAFSTGNNGASGTSTTIAFPNGLVVTAASGQGTSNNTGGAGGTATNGDVNLNGSAGGTSDGVTGQPGGAGLGTNGGAAGTASGAQSGGAGAPANFPFKGGNGGNVLGGRGSTPGGGSAVYTSNGSSVAGDGMVIVLMSKTQLK